MKPIITTTLVVAIAAVLLLVTATPSLAAHSTAPDGGCQPGADNQIIEGWQLLSIQEFADFIVEEFDVPNDIAPKIAENTYAFCDHNRDGYTCVMEQNLPNDANGSSHWWLVEDNHPFGGQ
jgi:hypothetical protein